MADQTDHIIQKFSTRTMRMRIACRTCGRKIAMMRNGLSMEHGFRKKGVSWYLEKAVKMLTRCKGSGETP